MILSWIWTGLAAVSVLIAISAGRGQALGAAVITGAQAGVTLAISLTGSICLWSGVGKLMTQLGLTEALSRLLSPLLYRLFPRTKAEKKLAGHLSGNICANLLGLGNAATPMGIEAAKGLRDPERPDYATDSLCRLIVLNTASIQLIPANVAAVRLGLGCASPFDILPAVWITSFSSAGLGLLAAILLGKVWKT
jgi:spore maturation protein A